MCPASMAADAYRPAMVPIQQYDAAEPGVHAIPSWHLAELHTYAPRRGIGAAPACRMVSTATTIEPHAIASSARLPSFCHHLAKPTFDCRARAPTAHRRRRRSGESLQRCALVREQNVGPIERRGLAPARCNASTNDARTAAAATNVGGALCGDAICGLVICSNPTGVSNSLVFPGSTCAASVTSATAARRDQDHRGGRWRSR